MAPFRFESNLRHAVGRACFGAFGWIATLATTGCVVGSLATSTGPRPDGFKWSSDEQQYAHVKENVSFDFVLTNWLGGFVDPVGIVDYGVTHFDGERIEMELDPAGHLMFKRPISATAGSSLTVQVTAYRQLAGRDQIKVGEEWVHSNSPFEQPDQKVAQDSVTLLIYQAKVRLRIPSPPDALDPETGVMRFHRHKGDTTSVYIDRPGRPGFRITGPDADAYYTVTYDPPGDVLNDHGSTAVDFTIYDLSGQRHEVNQQLDTP